MPSVVIDRGSVSAILKMASDEGLLFDKQNEGDKHLYSLRNLKVPIWHKQQILEQISFNDTLITLSKIPFDWMYGDFLKLNPLTAEPKPELLFEPVDQSRNFREIVEGLLLAGGHEQPFDTWIQLYDRFSEILEKVNEYDSLNPKSPINVLGTLVRGGLDKDYSASVEHRLAFKYNERYIQVGPFLNAAEEFLTLSRYAETSGTMLRTPLYQPSPNLYNLPETAGKDATAIYRSVCAELGSYPILRSLKQAMEHSKLPVVQDIKHNIDMWVASLQNDSVDVTRKIQKKIGRQNAAKDVADGLSNVGTAMDYVSVPVSFLGLINPFFASLGWSLSLVGAIFDVGGKQYKKKLSWISLGWWREQ